MLIVLLILCASAAPALDGADVFLLADSAQQAGAYANAASLFKQCAEESEILAPYALSRAAVNLSLAGGHSEAERLYNTVLERHPDGPWVRLTHARLGRLYLQLQQYDRAHQHLSRVVQELDPVPWFLIPLAASRARNALRLPQYASEGRDYYRQVTGTTIYNTERIDAARQLLDAPGQEERLWAIYGLARSGNLTEARAALGKEVIMLNGPGQVEAPYSMLDMILSGARMDMADAMSRLEYLIRENGGVFAVRVWLMLAAREEAVAGRTEAAEALAEMLIRHFGEGRDAGDVCWWLAERYEREENPRAADRMYGLLADRCPEHVRAPRSMYNLGNRAREEGRLQDAFAIYERLGRAHPHGIFTAEAYYRCAQMAARQGDADRERTYLAMAAGLGEGHFYAHRALHLVHRKEQSAPANPRRLRVVPEEDFIEAFPVEADRPAELVRLITHIPAYGRLQYFGINGLEEGEWETLYCILTSPASLEKLWYAVIAESGYMHTLLQFVNARSWGLGDDGRPTRARRRLEFPLAYWPEMKARALDLGLDPYLLLAIAKQESTFRASVVSSAGAQGVLQLMPPTAKWLVQADSRVNADHVRNLNSPLNSIHLGSVYMNRMMARSNNNLVYALASYNAGPGNCDRWRNRFSGYSTEAFIEAIPFRETNDYVKKVLANYATYHSLYPPPEQVVACTAATFQ